MTLQRVLVLNYIGEHPTVPELVRQLMEGSTHTAQGSEFERAIRDLDRGGHLSCRKSRIYPARLALDLLQERVSAYLAEAGGNVQPYTAGLRQASS